MNEFLNAEFADASQTTQNGKGMCHLRRAARAYDTMPLPSDARRSDCPSWHSRARRLYLDYERSNGASYSEREAPAREREGVVADGERADELESIRSRMLMLHPSRFEYLVKDVLERSGYCRVSTTRYSQDGGIDVNAYAGEWQWPIHPLRVQVQAKRWIHTVGRKEVAELRGSLARHARGALVTTSQFSKSALEEANDAEKLPIAMIDGYDFARIIRHFNVPVEDCA